MIQNQKRWYRTAFVLFCLLPTGLQLWSIFKHSDSAAPDSAGGMELKQVRSGRPSHLISTAGLNEKRKQKESQQKEIDATKTVGGKIEIHRTPWLNSQGIETAGRTDGSIVVQRKDWPAGHPFASLTLPEFRVTESNGRLDCHSTEWSLPQTELPRLLQQWCQPGFQRAFKEITLLVFRIDKASVGGSGNSARSPVLFRGLKLEVFPKQKKLNLTGRLVTEMQDFGVQNNRQIVVELPFRMSVDNKNGISMDLEGNRFPVSLLAPAWSETLGTGALLSGRILRTWQPDFAPTLRMEGTLSSVDCQPFTSWMVNGGDAIASGTCQIQCRQLWIVDRQLRLFEGEVQSNSAGSVSREISQLIGDSVSWQSQNNVAEFRSFLFLIRYVTGGTGAANLEVKSRYVNPGEGRQLIWTSDGTGVLNAN